MDQRNRNLAIHEGLTSLLEMKFSMMTTVFRCLAIGLGIPLAVFLSVTIIQFLFYVTDILRGVSH